MRRGVLVLGTCLALAGCGGTGGTADPGSTGTPRADRSGPSPTPPHSFTATGFLTAEGTFGVACSGVGRSAGLRRGSPVVVRDSHGVVVATGTLEDGFADDDAPQRRCIFPFTVRKIPEAGGPFTVRVADPPAAAPPRGGFFSRSAGEKPPEGGGRSPGGGAAGPAGGFDRRHATQAGLHIG